MAASDTKQGYYDSRTGIGCPNASFVDGEILCSKLDDYCSNTRYCGTVRRVVFTSYAAACPGRKNTGGECI